MGWRTPVVIVVCGCLVSMISFGPRATLGFFLTPMSQANGWSRDVYTVTPGIPGDSGSGFLSASGGAIGVLSTVQIAPLAGSNGVGDLAREIAYMQANSSFTGANVVHGIQPFNPNLVSAIAGS